MDARVAVSRRITNRLMKVAKFFGRCAFSWLNRDSAFTLGFGSPAAALATAFASPLQNAYSSTFFLGGGRGKGEGGCLVAVNISKRWVEEEGWPARASRVAGGGSERCVLMILLKLLLRVYENNNNIFCCWQTLPALHVRP